MFSSIDLLFNNHHFSDRRKASSPPALSIQSFDRAPFSSPISFQTLRLSILTIRHLARIGG